MLDKLEKKYCIPFSRCDRHYKMRISEILNVFMDIATEHAGALGCGQPVLDKQKLFWMVGYSALQINELPKHNDEVLLTTWPEAVHRGLSYRYYKMEKDGKVLVEGKTLWMLFDYTTMAIASSERSIIVNLPDNKDKCCTFRKNPLIDTYEKHEKVYDYVVGSNDVDVGFHMNNVSYVKSLFGAFNCDEIDSMPIKTFEIKFISQAKEGNTLSIYKRNVEDGIAMGAFIEDNKVAVLAKIGF